MSFSYIFYFWRLSDFLDNERAITIEIIFSRIMYAIAISRTTSGYINELRKARAADNKDSARELAKTISESVMNGAIRLYKLRNAWNVLQVTPTHQPKNLKFCSQDSREEQTAPNSSQTSSPSSSRSSN